MCGIAGVLGPAEITEPLLGRMLHCIEHRGPDDEGRLVAPTFAFGMRRLAIQDIAGGHQPMWSVDRSAVIVFNGEIYNFKELREELASSGYRFSTHCDTEVIVALYERIGRADPVAMLNRLRGMFAIAIHDIERDVLFLARDQFGIKPLYLHTVDGRIASFGSEIKSLLEDPSLARRVNDEAVVNYLAFQYNPLTETMFEGIRRVPPATYLLVSPRTGEFTEFPYWSYNFSAPTTATETAAQSSIRDVMRDSVEHHMISDVPVGAFLSGGVDSAITVTLMQERRRALGLDNVKTFTIGFDEVSELAEAREVSDRIGSDHHEIRVNMSEYLEVLEDISWHFDEPVADPSAVALYFLARAAREQVTVVLSGEGADELFGGYRIYREPLSLRPISRQPSWVQRTVLSPVSKISASYPGRNYLRRGLTPFDQRFIGNAYIFRPDEMRALWKSDLPTPAHVLPGLELGASISGFDDLSESRRMQLVDINYWMPGDILAKADRMTMAHSLEVRVPYLDMHVASVSSGIPDAWKYRDGTTKWILREAFRDILPSTTAARAKLGFPTPLRHWLKQDPEWFRSRILDDSYIRARMNAAPIERLFADHKSGERDTSRKIYILLMLALWRRAFNAN